MVKKIFWSIFSLALVFTASGCGTSQQSNPQSNQPAASVASKQESISGSIEDLVKLGRSIKCDIPKTDTSTISGTVYISGNKARSDFEVNNGSGSTIAAHFILDGVTMYSWNDADKTQAMKFSLSDMEKFKTNVQAKSGGVSNYSNKMDYSCTNWTVDSSYFVPPADINFSDFSQLINKIQSQLPNLKNDTSANSASNNQALCATCDKMPNAAVKAQCLQGLGCK